MFFFCFVFLTPFLLPNTVLLLIADTWRPTTVSFHHKKNVINNNKQNFSISNPFSVSPAIFTLFLAQEQVGESIAKQHTNTHTHPQIELHCLELFWLHLQQSSHTSDDSRVAFKKSLRQVFLFWAVAPVQRVLKWITEQWMTAPVTF